MPKFIAVLLLTSALVTPVVAQEVTAWRLFISDHAAPKLTALDVATGSTLATFPLASPATLYASASGEAVFAIQGAGNQVSAISSGVTIGDHGDHGDIKITQPALIEAVVRGAKPVHFVEHDGKIALSLMAPAKRASLMSTPGSRTPMSQRPISTAAHLITASRFLGAITPSFPCLT